MKRRAALILGIGCLSIVGLLLAAAFLVPAPFMPEWLYRLRYGHLYPTTGVVGDGSISDYGPSAGLDRYVVDLGEVQATEFSRSFSLSKLPHEWFVVGLEVFGGEGFGLLDEDKPDIGTARMELKRKSGELVILEEGPLKKWIWTFDLSRRNDAFLYKIGQSRQNTQDPNKPVDRKVDDGWGTTFVPLPGEEYQLDVTTSLTPEALQKYRFRLQARGGGWQQPRP